MLLVGLVNEADDDPRDADFDPTDGASNRGANQVSVFSTCFLMSSLSPAFLDVILAVMVFPLSLP